MRKRKSITLTAKLGENIAHRRKEVGLIQDELAESIGVDAETISRIERGINAPSLQTLEAISRHLGVAISELLSDELPGPISEAQLISTQMSRLKAKDREFLIELIQLFCRRHAK